METNIIDVNTETESSPAQMDEAAAQAAATTESSTELAAKSSSTDDIVNAVVEKHEETESAPKTDAEGKPLAPEKLPEGQTKKEEPVKTPEQLEKEKKENERFDKHPRFQEILTRAKTAEETVTKLKEQYKVWDDTRAFLQTNNITPEAYNETIQWRALAGSSDPKNVEQALVKAEEVCEQLRLRLGKSLPADLQEAVDAQQMTPEWAAKVAQTRMQAAGHESTVKHTEQLNQEQQRQLIQTSLGTWVTGKQATDPSFVESKDGEDGLFEDVGRRMNAICTQKINELKRPLNAAEMVQIAEDAYQGATKYRSRLIPAPPARKAPLNGSSRFNSDAVPKYDNDSIINDVASRHAGGL